MIEQPNDLLTKDGLFVKQITSIIDENLQNEELSSTFLADFCCMSQRHFSRRVKQTTGLDVTHFIRSRRILKACELLKNTNLPISGIYIKCGFESANYFTRVFRKHMGVPPSVYRTQR